MSRSVIENKHSTEIGALLTFRVNAHTDTRSIQRRWRGFNVGGVIVLNDPPAGRSSMGARGAGGAGGAAGAAGAGAVRCRRRGRCGGEKAENHDWVSQQGH